MYETRKSFLERLQLSDEATKRRFVFICTAIAMIVVVYVWFAYFNNMIASQNAPQPVAETSGFTFWQTMKGGMAVIYRAFWAKLNDLSNILQSPREYIIKPPQ